MGGPIDVRRQTFTHEGIQIHSASRHHNPSGMEGFLLRRPPWYGDAACKDKPKEWWFVDTKGGSLERRAARMICAECPVRTECLQHALTKYEAGMWGGTTDKERANIRLGRVVPEVHGTRNGYKRHLKNGTQPCDECLEAKRAYEATVKRKPRRQTPEQVARQSASRRASRARAVS